MTWFNKRVLVTGAGGFIGSQLIEELAEKGADVTAFIHYNSNSSRGWLEKSPYKNNIRFHMGDLTSIDSVLDATKKIDIVFHLGALISIPYSYVNPRSFFETNVNGTLNLLQACKFNDVGRLVHTSTSEVYGTPSVVPITEEHPLQAQSPYAASKIAADKAVESFYLSYDLPVVTVRPFNTYGPRQSNRAIIPTLITQMLTQSEIKVGSLKPKRDLNYIADTIQGFLAIALCDQLLGETVNIGSGKEYSIGEVAGIIQEVIGREVFLVTDQKRIRPEKSEVMRLLADNSKIQAFTDWKPTYSLKEGLKQTIEWIAKQIDYFDVTEYNI